MTLLDTPTIAPARLAEDGRRVTCPRCREGTVAREEISGTPAARRIHATCTNLDCHWQQFVEIPRPPPRKSGDEPEPPRTYEPADPTRRTLARWNDPTPDTATPFRLPRAIPVTELVVEDDQPSPRKEPTMPATTATGRTPDPGHLRDTLTRGEKMRWAFYRKRFPEVSIATWIARGKPKPPRSRGPREGASKPRRSAQNGASKPSPSTQQGGGNPRRDLAAVAPPPPPEAPPVPGATPDEAHVRVFFVEYRGPLAAGTANALADLIRQALQR